MASIGKDPNGRKRILLVAPDGSRKTIRLGRCDIKQAESFRVKLEALVASRITGAVDASLANWLRHLPDAIHVRLVAAGLTESRQITRATLGALVSSYFSSLNVKQGTIDAYRQASQSLEAHFGADRLLASITPLHAEAWVKSLRDEGLAQATRGKRVRTAKTIFGKAVRWKLIADNPFQDVKAGSQTNRARAFFVSRQDFDRVVAACPDAEWRVILALARYGGLRCPSEILSLTWRDVNFAESRLRVTSPKTAHHEGHEQRFMPLFPELREPLLQAFERAATGTQHVVTRYRSTNANLRTQLFRILDRAGVKPWPRLFQNLRASRQTELAAEYPLADVCAWLGNSPAIASGHYLQATDANFERASREPTRGTDSGTRVAQKPAQHAEAGDRISRQTPPQVLDPHAFTQDSAPECESLQTMGMGAGGFEPP